MGIVDPLCTFKAFLHRISGMNKVVKQKCIESRQGSPRLVNCVLAVEVSILSRRAEVASAVLRGSWKNCSKYPAPPNNKNNTNHTFLINLY